MKRKRHMIEIREALVGYLCIAPMILGLGVFSYYAFFRNIFLSFFNSKLFNPGRFVGLDNYKNLLADDKFIVAFVNTIVYVISVVPVVVPASILIAVLLNSDIKGRGFFRTLIFTPLVTTAAAIAMTFRWIFNTRYGLVNMALNSLGLESQRWLTSPELIQFTVIMVMIWSIIGYCVVIMMAGLQSIPNVYYEAAKIDGAGRVRQFFNITLPLLTPSIHFVLTFLTIGVFKEFSTVWLLVPAGEFYTYSPVIAASTTLVRFFYDTGIRNDVEVGYAAASSVYLFIIVMICTLVLNRLQHKWVYYEYKGDKR